MPGPLYGSMGSLIIDDIRFEDGREQHGVLGGAGVFAVYGMRLWLTQQDAHQVGYIVQKGDDHPSAIDDQLAALAITRIDRVHPGQHTTRGRNVFGLNDHRDFEYVYPILRTLPEHVPDSWIDSLGMVHVIAAAERAKSISCTMQARRASHRPPMHFIWEPLPWDCVPESLDAVCSAARTMTIVSPNHEEAAALVGHSPALDAHTIEACAAAFFRAIHNVSGEGQAPTTIVVLRAGRLGSVVVQDDRPGRWVPAYHHDSEAAAVCDVTGAGNTYCGGFAVGWVESGHNPVRAAMYGAVSASFAIEQVGMPVLHANDTWNAGPSPRARLERLDRAMNSTP